MDGFRRDGYAISLLCNNIFAWIERLEPHTRLRMKQAHRSPPAETSERSEAWLEAFTAQCTNQLYEVARRFAARRAAVVARCGGVVDDYYVRELVANAVSDTAAGVLRWNPAAQSLEAHVLDAISRRANHDCSRALRYRHEAVDLFDPEVPRALIDEVEAKLADAVPGLGFRLRLDHGERVQRLRELAGPDDAHVLLILDAFEAEAVTKSDVLHFTGLSDKEYRAARKRLVRLAAKRSPSESSSRPRLKKWA